MPLEQVLMPLEKLPAQDAVLKQNPLEHSYSRTNCTGSGGGKEGGGGGGKGGCGSGMMKAPGGGGDCISRAGFESNPQGYFSGLHS
ncbi:hypothetical protein BUALT_Bualt05G0116900 [Buddleja alternifolia]|uniref:Uncharacterized protein n=1 Tax=Buddleja alternifolia TaxID=168488 RepID=A0AAV6XUY8_9LAMI|nr:hypothetical protein BUALT_Bualt05G0116900 [Buddleja alternifolia]